MNEDEKYTPSEAEGFVAPSVEGESEKKIEDTFVEVIGDVDPRTLSEEQFKQSAWLFHAARRGDFTVESQFDYEKSEMVDGATLGYGLYTTANRNQAENYANIRPDSTVFELMPYQSRMLNLTSKNEVKNTSIPKEIAREWIEFARERVLERALNSNYLIKERLNEVLGLMPQLENKDFIDLRRDILGTERNPFSIIEDVWREFCKQKDWDGIIYIEGGEDEFSQHPDRTYVFYNLNKIGTYQDWQSDVTKMRT